MRRTSPRICAFWLSAGPASAMTSSARRRSSSRSPRGVRRTPATAGRTTRRTADAAGRPRAANARTSSATRSSRPCSASATTRSRSPKAQAPDRPARWRSGRSRPTRPRAVPRRRDRRWRRSAPRGRGRRRLRAEPPGHGHRLRGQGYPALGGAEERQGDGEPGQQVCALLAVVLGKQRQRLLQQIDLGVVEQPHLEAGEPRREAERRAGEVLGTSGWPARGRTPRRTRPGPQRGHRSAGGSRRNDAAAGALGVVGRHTGQRTGEGAGGDLVRLGVGRRPRPRRPSGGRPLPAEPAAPRR